MKVGKGNPWLSVHVIVKLVPESTLWSALGSIETEGWTVCVCVCACVCVLIHQIRMLCVALDNNCNDMFSYPQYLIK